MSKKYKSILGFSNAKTVKGEKKGYLTGILYMAPSNTVNGINTCPFATAGCRKACLYTAGRGKFSNVQQARINKTILFRDNREFFLECLERDINKGLKKAEKENKIFVVRLNGTTDISWESIKVRDGKNIFELYPQLQFYDYTKNYTRLEALTGKWSNYHLTFSMAETAKNQREALNLLEMGVNVAIVFRKELPEKFNGFVVFNGDETDLRFLDEKNKVIGLVAKGEAKKDKTGFVQG